MALCMVSGKGRLARRVFPLAVAVLASALLCPCVESTQHSAPAAAIALRGGFVATAGLLRGGSASSGDTETFWSTTSRVGAAAAAGSGGGEREAVGGGGDESHDLYIVGTGYLGCLIAEQWKSQFPGGSIYGETRTESRHTDLAQMGIEPRLRSQRDGTRHPNVVFCAPPSGNDDYPAEVAEAAGLWDGTGAFVFTSSGGVYAEKDGGVVTETSPLLDTERIQKFKEAEAACVKKGGCAVRLAGLYALERGAHSFWLNKGVVNGSPAGLINLLSYEDAAGAVIAALRAGHREETYLVSDGNPMSRLGIVEAAISHPDYKDKPVPEFLEGEGARMDQGKIYDASASLAKLQWTPVYASFTDYMKRKAAET